MIQTSASSLASRIAQAAVPQVGGSAGFLKFDFNNGEWSYGREMDDVTDDEVLINTNTICHGYILWSGGKATKTLTTFDQEKPMPMAPIGTDQPSEARAFMGAFYDDGTPGEQFTFETNSFGGRKGVDTLITEIINRVAVGEVTYLYPLVKLSSDSYKNTKHHNKLIHNPKFEVIAWADQNGNLQGEAAPQLEAPEEVEEPVRRRRV